MKINMNPSVKKYLASIGRKGGAAGRGQAKARTSEQARKATLARIKKYGQTPRNIAQTEQ